MLDEIRHCASRMEIKPANRDLLVKCLERFVQLEQQHSNRRGRINQAFKTMLDNIAEQFEEGEDA